MVAKPVELKVTIAVKGGTGADDGVEDLPAPVRLASQESGDATIIGALLRDLMNLLRKANTPLRLLFIQEFSGCY